MARQVVEEEHLEGEGDEDVEGVLDEADHVRLLQLQGQDVDDLLAEQGLEHREHRLARTRQFRLSPSFSSSVRFRVVTRQLKKLSNLFRL